MSYNRLLLALALCVACGGRVEGPVGDDGGSPSDDAGQDGGASSFPVCPADPPHIGAPCSSRQQGCAYVTVKGDCEAYACDGTWRSAPEGC